MSLEHVTVVKSNYDEFSKFFLLRLDLVWRIIKHCCWCKSFHVIKLLRVFCSFPLRLLKLVSKISIVEFEIVVSPPDPLKPSIIVNLQLILFLWLFFYRRSLRTWTLRTLISWLFCKPWRRRFLFVVEMIWCLSISGSIGLMKIAKMSSFLFFIIK